MLTAFIMATALQGSALVEEADNRNLAYTQCLFEQVREAREESLPMDRMLARLESACADKRRALEEVTIAIRREQGETQSEAQANWDRVHANSIEAIRRAYELRLAELQG